MKIFQNKSVINYAMTAAASVFGLTKKDVLAETATVGDGDFLDQIWTSRLVAAMRDARLHVAGFGLDELNLGVLMDPAKLSRHEICETYKNLDSALCRVVGKPSGLLLALHVRGHLWCMTGAAKNEALNDANHGPFTACLLTADIEDAGACHMFMPFKSYLNWRYPRAQGEE